jgi:hypothetical protein
MIIATAAYTVMYQTTDRQPVCHFMVSRVPRMSTVFKY